MIRWIEQFSRTATLCRCAISSTAYACPRATLNTHHPRTRELLITRDSRARSLLLPPLSYKKAPSDPAGENKKANPMSNLVEKAKEFLAEKIANVSKPEATVTDVSVKRLGRDGAHFNSEVSVDNPYSHRLPICDVTYTLKSAGRIVATGSMADPGWIEASGLTKLEIPFKVPYDFLMSLIRDIGRDWDIDYELEVGLTIDLPIIGNFTIPITSKGEMKLPSISDFFSSN